MSFFVLTPEQSRNVDDAASRRLGIHGLVLMENAARGATHLVQTRWPSAGPILIICGSGNNGGDGYAIARQLLIRNRDVHVLALHPPREGSDAQVNRRILENMGQPIATPAELPQFAPQAELIIDAILGTGLDRDVTGEPAHAMAVINECSAPTLAVDIPSGLDANHGRPLGIAVQAAATVTFVGPKPGLLTESSRQWVGDLYISDIGAPNELAAEFGTPIEEFVQATAGIESTPELTWVDDYGAAAHDRTPPTFPESP